MARQAPTLPLMTSDPEPAHTCLLSHFHLLLKGLKSKALQNDLQFQQEKYTHMPFKSSVFPVFLQLLSN